MPQVSKKGLVSLAQLTRNVIRQDTLKRLAALMKKPSIKKRPFVVRTVQDVLICARNIQSANLAPVFLTSAVTGRGLDLLRCFFNLMPQVSIRHSNARHELLGWLAHCMHCAGCSASAGLSAHRRQRSSSLTRRLESRVWELWWLGHSRRASSGPTLASCLGRTLGMVPSRPRP